MKRKTCNWGFAVAAALCMGLASMAQAVSPTVVYVDDSFTPGSCGGHTWGVDAFSNINAGVSAVAASGTVNVAAGTYHESQIVVLFKGLTLQGAGPAVTTIDGNNAVISGSGTRPGTIYFKNPDASVKIDGFTFTNPVNNTTIGEVASIAIAFGSGAPTPLSVTISHNHFIGVADNDPNAFDNAIWIYGAPVGVVSHIENNEFDHLWQPILLEQPWGGAVITGNSFHDLFISGVNPPQALSLWAYDGVDVTAPVTINSNTFSAFDGWSIVLRGGYGSGNAQFINNVTIENNTITADGVGIVLRNPATTLGDAALDGIVGATISGNTINSITPGTGTGIWLRGPNNNTAITDISVKNTISGFANGILSEQYNVSSTSSGIVVHGNSLTGNTIAVSNQGPSIIDATSNYWGAADGPGPVGPGSGDKISINVLYSPWYADAAMTLYYTPPFTVSKADQIITFHSIADQDVTNRLTLSATASSGLPVTNFAVISGPAGISGLSNVTFTGTGLVSIVASQAGDTNWNAAPNLTNTFQVTNVTSGVADALALSDFMFLPRAIHIGAHPSNIKFTLKNNGPLDMSTPNTRVLLEFYLSTDTHFSESVDVKIGEYGMDITLPTGASTDVHLQNRMLEDLTIPTMKHGEYYVFLRVRHVSPSGLYYPNSTNVVMRDGTIKVGLGHDGVQSQPVKNDYDGDGISDLALYKESTGNWAFLLSGSGYAPVTTNFGGPGDRPILGDYDGDGKNDLTLYNAATGRWLILLSGSGQQIDDVLGGAGSIPVTGDYDGDGKTDPTVYQESTGKWSVLLSNSGYEPAEFELGGPGYQAISGDFDGDGKSDPAVYNKSTGRLKAMLSGSGYQTADVLLGVSGYQAVPGDYDWDGKTDPAIYNESTGEWIVWLSSGNYGPVSMVLGGTGCSAVPDDYDGDGKVDPAYYKESSGLWVVLLSGQGYQPVSAQCGSPGYHAVGATQ